MCYYFIDNTGGYYKFEGMSCATIHQLLDARGLQYQQITEQQYNDFVRSI